MICPICNYKIIGGTSCKKDLTTHQTNSFIYGYRIFIVNPRIVIDAFDYLSSNHQDKTFFGHYQGNIPFAVHSNKDAFLTTTFIPPDQIKPYIDKIIKLKAFI